MERPTERRCRICDRGIESVPPSPSAALLARVLCEECNGEFLASREYDRAVLALRDFAERRRAERTVERERAAEGEKK